MTLRKSTFIFILFTLGIGDKVTAQKYTYWGVQILPLTTINKDNQLETDKIGQGISGGLLFDWLVFGDFGSIRLESNYMNYSLLLKNSANENLKKNIQVIDIPISYRWTYIFYSHFNLFLGGGTQVALNDNLKNSIYLMYGFDYYFYTERIKNPYFIGLCLKQGLVDQAKVPDYSVKPIMLQLTIGKTFPLTPGR